jgi:dTMP kinase
MAQRGKFITLEGGEGAGKSTQARRLAECLARAGLPVLRTREPGGPPTAEALRDLLLRHGPWELVAEAMLMFAARREHLVALIRPFLEAGGWVVCDRFADSTRAYQGAQGLPHHVWSRLAEITLDGLVPDLTLVLDLPPEEGIARAAARSGADRYERMDLRFHGAVRRAFLDIAAAEPGRCAVIDAMPPADDVSAAILAEVSARLGVPGLDRARPAA